MSSHRTPLRFLSVFLVASLLLGTLQPCFAYGPSFAAPTKRIAPAASTAHVAAVAPRSPLRARLSDVKKERLDKRLLTRLAKRCRALLGAICRHVSVSEDHDLTLKTFLCDSRHRVFAEIEGSVTIHFPILSAAWTRKLRDGAGTHVATNGSVALDFCLLRTEEIAPKTWRIHFRTDIVIILREAVEQVFKKVAALLGAFTLGAVLEKLVQFFDDIDGTVLCGAALEGTNKLWALVGGKAGQRTYRILDKAGQVNVKAVLMDGFSPAAVAYHFGAFILKGGLRAGVVLAKNLLFGAAVGASLSTAIGPTVGAALAAVTAFLIGRVITNKLTRDLPLWLKFRKIRRLFAKGAAARPGSPEALRHADALGAVEDEVADWIDDEIQADSFPLFDRIVSKLEEAARVKDLDPFEGLLAKLLDKLRFAAVHSEDWNAARKYYQLLKAIQRLPKGSVEPKGPTAPRGSETRSGRSPSKSTAFRVSPSR